MISSLSLKLHYMEVATLTSICWDMGTVLKTSGNNLYRLAGIVLDELSARLDKKPEYQGKRIVKLSLKECLVLKQFLLDLIPQENPYATVVRNEVFQIIDQKI